MFAIPAPKFRSPIPFPIARAAGSTARAPTRHKSSFPRVPPRHPLALCPDESSLRFSSPCAARASRSTAAAPPRLGDSHSHVQLLLQGGGNLVQYLCPAMVHDQVEKVLRRGIQPHLRGHFVD